MQTTSSQFTLVLLSALGAIVCTILVSIAYSVILIVAAKKILVCNSRWPAYVILCSAIFSVLSLVLSLSLNPIARTHGLGIRIETYTKLSAIVTPLGWIVHIGLAIAVLAVCRRLALSTKVEATENSNQAQGPTT